MLQLHGAAIGSYKKLKEKLSQISNIPLECTAVCGEVKVAFESHLQKICHELGPPNQPKRAGDLGEEEFPSPPPLSLALSI